MVEPGWNCSGGDLSNADSCVSVCGDGLRVQGELCSLLKNPDIVK